MLILVLAIFNNTVVKQLENDHRGGPVVQEYYITIRFLQNF